LNDVSPELHRGPIEGAAECLLLFFRGGDTPRAPRGFYRRMGRRNAYLAVVLAVAAFCGFSSLQAGKTWRAVGVSCRMRSTAKVRISPDLWSSPTT